MKVTSRCDCELSLQSCPTLWDPMDSSLPSFSVHAIPQTRILEWVAMPSSGIFPTQGSNPYLLWLLHWWILYCWPPGKPNFYKQKSDWPKNMKRCSTAMKLKWIENNALFHTHQIGINFKMWQYPVLSRIWNRAWLPLMVGVKCSTKHMKKQFSII